MTIKELKRICDAFIENGNGDKIVLLFCEEHATLYGVECVRDNCGCLQLDAD